MDEFAVKLQVEVESSSRWSWWSDWLNLGGALNAPSIGLQCDSKFWRLPGATSAYLASKPQFPYSNRIYHAISLHTKYHSKLPSLKYICTVFRKVPTVVIGCQCLGDRADSPCRWSYQRTKVPTCRYLTTTRYSVVLRSMEYSYFSVLRTPYIVCNPVAGGQTSG